MQKQDNETFGFEIQVRHFIRFQIQFCLEFKKYVLQQQQKCFNRIVSPAE